MHDFLNTIFFPPICGSEEEDSLPDHPRFDTFRFLWGFVKTVVYQGDRPTTLEELNYRITNAATLVTPHMLRITWWEVAYRICVCRVIQGSRTELNEPSSETW